ncbi:MAG: MBL fold metallo-hydrolase [Vicinamibacterales bacterium]
MTAEDTRARAPARVTFLGTGTSHGVPMIGCECATCRSADPRDRRLRPSVVIAIENGPTLLIDTSTDLRQQALTHRLSRVDAILFTHSHADHVMGMDEIRRFNVLQKQAIPAYADATTAEDIRRTFSYAFAPPAQKGGGVPQIELTTIDGALTVEGIAVTPVPIWHGKRPILGYRLGAFAYLTDCSGIPDASWPLLEGLDVLVLDALRHRPHPTHYTVADALTAIERIQPGRALLTHICHDLPHEETNRALPPGVELAYDGLQIDVTVARA